MTWTKICLQDIENMIRAQDKIIDTDYELTLNVNKERIESSMTGKINERNKLLFGFNTYMNMALYAWLKLYDYSHDKEGKILSIELFKAFKEKMEEFLKFAEKDLKEKEN